MPKVISNLWFAEQAREAVEFYISIIPDSRIGRTTILPAETPSGPPGSVELIEFTLGDQAFLAMKAGPLDSFNHSFSIAVLLEAKPRSIGSGMLFSPMAARLRLAAG